MRAVPSDNSVSPGEAREQGASGTWSRRAQPAPGAAGAPLLSPQPQSLRTSIHRTENHAEGERGLLQCFLSSASRGHGSHQMPRPLPVTPGGRPVPGRCAAFPAGLREAGRWAPSLQLINAPQLSPAPPPLDTALTGGSRRPLGPHVLRAHSRVLLTWQLSNHGQLCGCLTAPLADPSRLPSEISRP